MIEWQEGAVCYANGDQWFISEITSYTKIFNHEDFQLNEIRIGDYIERSELDTEQKYNDAVEVFGLFGFEHGEGAEPRFKDVDIYGNLTICHDGIYATELTRKWCKRKLTYNQIMVIGKLKRLLDEKSAVKESESVNRVAATGSVGCLSVDLVDAHRKINEALSKHRVSEDNLKDGAKYVKTLYGLDGKKTTTDIYRVLDAFQTGSSEIDHAVKKLLNAGGRGHKDELTDLYNAIESIEARINLIKQKGDS